MKCTKLEDLTVGITININGECIGIITKEEHDRIYIESKCFTGWATKCEIRKAIISPATDWE